MSFSLQRYFSNLFIAIVVEANICRLLGKVVKNKTIIKTFETVFDNPDNEKIDPKIIKYIEEKSKEYHDVYIALYLNSVGQGAIEGTSAKDFNKHSVDMKNVNYVSIEKSWLAYASYIDVKWAKSMFEPLHLDLLYSPFLLLYESLKKQQEIPKETTLYIYSHEDSCAVAVFKETKLLFGSFFKDATSGDSILDDMNTFQDWNQVEEESIIEDDSLKDDSLEIDLDSIDELENIEDLEDFETISDEFNMTEDKKDSSKQGFIEQGAKHNAELSIELLGKNMKLYKYITSAINEFYEDPIYSSSFIEKIVVFENHRLGDSVRSIIENELFIKVTCHEARTLDTLCNLAIRDIPL